MKFIWYTELLNLCLTEMNIEYRVSGTSNVEWNVYTKWNDGNERGIRTRLRPEMNTGNIHIVNGLSDFQLCHKI